MTESLKEQDETPGMHMHRGKAIWGHSKKAAACKPRREVSEETNPVDTLILDLTVSRTMRQYISVD